MAWTPEKNPTVVYAIFIQSSRSLLALVTILASFLGNLVDFKGVKTVKQKKNQLYHIKYTLHTDWHNYVF